MQRPVSSPGDRLHFCACTGGVVATLVLYGVCQVRERGMEERRGTKQKQPRTPPPTSYPPTLTGTYHDAPL